MCLVALSKIYREERGPQQLSAHPTVPHPRQQHRRVVYIITYTRYTNNELTQQTNTLK